MSKEYELKKSFKVLNLKEKPKYIIGLDKDENNNVVEVPKEIKECETKIQYKQTAIVKESHKRALYGLSTNERIRERNSDPIIFVSVGGPFVSFYECLESDATNNIKFLQAYQDPDPEEDFYCCAWSYYVPLQNRGDNYSNGNSDSYTVNCVGAFPIVATAGRRGVIRIICPNMGGAILNLVGHGHSINEILFHPHSPDLLFTFSKDYTVRMWNVWTNVLVCVFGGSDGHRSEILFGDVDMTGQFVLSCGMDHTIKIWALNSDRVAAAIARSRQYLSSDDDRVFATYLEHYPCFSTNSVHSNYIDCGRWFGRLVFSKSCEGQLTLWRPGQLGPDLASQPLLSLSTKASVLHQFGLIDCDIWCLRFDINLNRRLLALGNRTGTIFIWNLNDTSTKNGIFGIQPQQLQLSVKNSHSITIRQTRFTNDAKILLCVCDAGLIVRFDMV